MELIEGFYIDKNNNKWDSKWYPLEQAVRYSDSLVNCHGCYNCDNCNYYYGCHDCRNCYDCDYCYECYGCNYCRNCCGCRNCDGCYNCYNCRDCYGCHDYIDNPQRYVTKRMGSRDDNTYFYYGETKDSMSLQVICGCFRGNLEEFEKAVLKTHKDNELYRKQYLSEIKKVKKLFRL